MNKNLKVIQLIDSLNPGGAEMMAVNIANALAEQGIESHLCTARLEGTLMSKIDESVGCLFLNKKNSFDIKAIVKLYNYIKAHRISIVHAHSSSYFMGFLIKIVRPSIRIIWQDHYGNSEHLKNRNTFPLALISYVFEAIIVVNTLLYEWAKKELKTKKVSYIPNFATLNTVLPKATLLHGVKNKRIVCLANLRPQKDHLNLLKAFKLVNEAHTDWTLHLVGLDLKDSYSEEIKLFIKSEHLQNHVFLYGSCADTKHVLEQASIGVLASKSEGLPVALLEYGLAKLPVVITDVGECGKVITHKKHGLVVAPNNAQKLAKEIMNLIEDTNASIKYGVNLYKEVQLNYSKKKYLKNIMAMYTNE
tara:strand:- start:29237 stop:30322 length:1086 start_codon:yes stop_codon:yes gene_type:complete